MTARGSDRPRGRRRARDAIGAEVPAGTTELGHRHHQGRADPGPSIGSAAVLGARPDDRAERRYVRDRPETFAGRWAAKEAVSKVLGLGVRGIGWRDIEIERLPTGQPAVRLHGRAARRRAARDGPDRGLDHPRGRLRGRDRVRGPDRRAAGYVFPLDIEDRLDDRERRILARIERLRGRTTRRAPAGRRSPGEEPTMPERRPVGFGRRDGDPTPADRPRRRSPGAVTLDDAIAAGLLAPSAQRGHKGSFGKVLVIAGSLDYAGAALLVCRAAGGPAPAS